MNYINKLHNILNESDEDKMRQRFDNAVKLYNYVISHFGDRVEPDDSLDYLDDVEHYKSSLVYLESDDNNDFDFDPNSPRIPDEGDEWGESSYIHIRACYYKREYYHFLSTFRDWEANPDSIPQPHSLEEMEGYIANTKIVNPVFSVDAYVNGMSIGDIRDILIENYQLDNVDNLYNYVMKRINNMIKIIKRYEGMDRWDEDDVYDPDEHFEQEAEDYWNTRGL